MSRSLPLIQPWKTKKPLCKCKEALCTAGRTRTGTRDKSELDFKSNVSTNSTTAAGGAANIQLNL